MASDSQQHPNEHRQPEQLTEGLFELPARKTPDLRARKALLLRQQEEMRREGNEETRHE